MMKDLLEKKKNEYLNLIQESHIKQDILEYSV